MIVSDGDGEKRRLPRVVGAMNATVVLVIVTALVAGGAAALIGGSFSSLGDGYGGLWGVPALVLPLIALVLGVVAAIKIARSLGRGSGRLRIVLLVVVGVWVVAIGYSEVAHLVDPCVHGWWDETSQVGSQPLCERFGSELNWNTRFHLLAHAVPAGVILALYLWTVQRWARPQNDNSSAPLEPTVLAHDAADGTR